MLSSLVYVPQSLINLDSLSTSLDKIKNVINKVSVTIGKIVVEVFGFTINDHLEAFQSKNDALDVNKLIPTSCNITEKIKNTALPFDLVFPQSEVNALSNRQKMLDDSFWKSFNAKEDDSKIFFPTFEKLKASVQKLDFKGCFVDVSRCRERVNFHLTFNGDLFVSLAKTIDSIESNDVMFSISRKKRKIIISQMNIDELIEKIKEVQEIIEEAEAQCPIPAN
jgi:hypothetical protein